MSQQNRSRIALGLILILIGAFSLARLFIPGLNAWLQFNFAWPFWIIGVGALFLLIGLLIGAPGMAVPAALIAGVGGILYYQYLTDDWQSWGYLWTLIPGFVGLGTIIAGLLGENPRQSLRSGFSSIVVSLFLLVIFAAIFDRAGNLAARYWPILVILLGLWILVQNAFRRR